MLISRTGRTDGAADMLGHLQRISAWLSGSGLIARWALAGATVAFCVWIAISAKIQHSQIQVAEASRKSEYRRPANAQVHAVGDDASNEVKLGRALFFDSALSRSQLHSCASCHQPDKSWGDGLPRAKGEGEQAFPVRSPTLLNVGWVPILGWDGKFRDLEAVTFSAISNPLIMNLGVREALDRLAARPGYVAAFAQAFPGEGITRRTVEAAIAAFERTIVSGRAAFDRWVEGDDAAISAEAKRGFELFTGKARCAGCHGGWNLTDSSFHDIGVATREDIGRGRRFPNSPSLAYAFKTPTLRDVARRAPYMHDGSIPTLEAVIDLYDKGGIDRPSRSKLIRPLALTGGEKADLIAFLRTLDEEPEPVAVSASRD